MGFEVDRFSQQPSAEFICIICTSVLDDPVQCGNHHNFCRACIAKWLSTLNDGTGELNCSCPACRSEMSTQRLKESPRNLKRRLNKLQILCSHPNCDHGFLDLDCILKHEESCKFQREKIHCVFGCGVFYYSEEELNDHLPGCDKYVDFLFRLENNARDIDLSSGQNVDARVGGRSGQSTSLVARNVQPPPELENEVPRPMASRPRSRCRASTIVSVMLASMVFIALLIYLLFQFGRDILKSLHIV